MGQEHVLIDATEERCILVGVIPQESTEAQAIEYIEELEFLALTAGAITQKYFLQNVQFPNPKTYVGKGKLEEIKQYINATNIELVVFDDELSPSQLRNIERELECKVIDRQLLFSSP